LKAQTFRTEPSESNRRKSFETDGEDQDEQIS